MSRKKRIALITTWFPPKTSSAVNRMFTFAGYLSKNYEVEVFTESASTGTKTIDEIKVHYLNANSVWNRWRHSHDDNWLKHNFISVLNVSKGLVGISDYKNWAKAALKHIQKCNNEQPFDLIISSYAPFDAHWVAIKFLTKKRIPWIADMRDEMSQNPFATLGEKRHLRKQEKKVGNRASAITSVSAPILRDFERLMPKIKHFTEIRNGFNHEIKPENRTANQDFTIGYFGNFYGKRKPDTFFQVLEKLIVNKNLKVKIKIVGAHRNTFHIPSVLDEVIETLPQVGYIDAIRLMAKMDANLLIHPSGHHKGVYTGKLFDYISVARPVIGIIDKNDVAAELIDEFNCGYIADYYDTNEIETMVLAAYADWKIGKVRRATDAQIATLHRKHGVKILSELIETLTT